jgi:hypothetical protein
MKDRCPVPRRSHTIHAAVFTAVLLSGIGRATQITAQTDGTPIRLQTAAEPGKWITGRAAGITTDSIGIVPDASADTLRYARHELQRLKVSVGRKSNAGRGALIGAVVLGGFGAAFGAYGAGVCGGCDNNATGTFVAVFGLSGAALGAGIGAAIGSGSHREQWEAVAVVPSPASGTGGAGESP